MALKLKDFCTVTQYYYRNIRRLTAIRGMASVLQSKWTIC